MFSARTIHVFQLVQVRWMALKRRQGACPGARAHPVGAADVHALYLKAHPARVRGPGDGKRVGERQRGHAPVGVLRLIQLAIAARALPHARRQPLPHPGTFAACKVRARAAASHARHHVDGGRVRASGGAAPQACQSWACTDSCRPGRRRSLSARPVTASERRRAAAAATAESHDTRQAYPDSSWRQGAPLFHRASLTAARRRSSRAAPRRARLT